MRYLMMVFALAVMLGIGTGSCPAAGGQAGKRSGKSGTVHLSWNPVTDRSGKRPEILAGYKVYYGRASRSYTDSVDVGLKTSATLRGLKPGTYFFAVTAYDRSGLESDYSAEVRKRLH